MVRCALRLISGVCPVWAPVGGAVARSWSRHWGDKSEQNRAAFLTSERERVFLDTLEKTNETLNIKNRFTSSQCVLQSVSSWNWLQWRDWNRNTVIKHKHMGIKHVCTADSDPFVIKSGKMTRLEPFRRLKRRVRGRRWQWRSRFRGEASIVPRNKKNGIATFCLAKIKNCEI